MATQNAVELSIECLLRVKTGNALVEQKICA
jgi:hypothetical protein